MAARVEPKPWTAHYNVGVVCHEIGELPDAIEALTESIAIDATRAMAWNERAACWGQTYSEDRDLRHLQRAIDDLREALRLDPTFTLAEQNLKQAEQLLREQKR